MESSGPLLIRAYALPAGILTCRAFYFKETFMNETLAAVVSSVVTALVLGFGFLIYKLQTDRAQHAQAEDPRSILNEKNCAIFDRFSRC
jgi:energy-converting hydrogenase Eha subunit A